MQQKQPTTQMLQWNKQLETGHITVDEQHRMLISYINRLGILPLNNNPERAELEFILDLVDYLQRYTQLHFQHEEECMHRFQCPAYQQNKEAHGVFLQFFNEFKRRFDTEGYHANMARELHTRCSEWIEQHIVHIDMQLKGCGSLRSG